MAIRYKNPQTGEYEVIKIPVVKGEQGHAGIHVGTDAPPTTDVKLWFDPSDTDNDVDLANRLDTTLTACYDYMGSDRGSIKAAADANVDWLLGEINTVHYDGQHITATDTIEGRSKSAILMGSTKWTNTNGDVFDAFFNPVTNFDFENGYLKTDGTLTYDGGHFATQFIDITNFDGIEMGKEGVYYGKLCFYDGDKNFIAWVAKEGTTGIVKVESIPSNAKYIRYSAITKDIFIKDNEGRDLALPLSLVSVKMPVLCTTGKNLFDKSKVKYNTTIIAGNGQEEANNLYMSSDFISVKPNENYISNNMGVIFFYNENRQYIGEKNNGTVPQKFTTPVNCKYIRVRCWTQYSEVEKQKEVVESEQIEQDSTVTTYEPYKSNILTVNEEVELRGIGEVRDELNLLNGKLTQRIREASINEVINNQSWHDGANKNYPYYIYTQIGDKKKGSVYICDKLPFVDRPLVEDITGECLSNFAYEWSNSMVYFPGNGITDKESALQRLSSYNALINYELATESVKTVDLSDNHVYSHKDVTHYDCSSAEGSLVPTLSIDVPTNLSALVTKQRQQIRTLEEENKELNQELQLAITSSEENDNELLAQSFELDFRLMEVECALDLPMAATFRLGGKAMAMTPYEMAKKLILADNYDRADMEHKLDVYVSKKRMTEAERQELIQLMDEKEGVITIDPVEPEVEESIIEHEAVTIPLH